MYYSKIYKTSIIDGPGVRVSLYVSGCRNHCPGCHNPESWNFCFGHKFTTQTLEALIELLSRPYISGLTVVGGEPMEPENQVELDKILNIIKQKYPNKTIWCYTGYEFEDIMPQGKKYIDITSHLLSLIDVMVIGHFDFNQRDISDNNRWRGSRNQRIIDLRQSLVCGEPVMVSGIPNNN